MFFDEEIFVGIDPGGGRSQTVWAAINLQGDVLSIREGTIDEAVTFVLGIPRVTVAINSPASVSHQLLNDPQVRAGLQPRPKPGKYSQYRVCEYLLKCRNIRLIPAPSQPELAPDWMQKGFNLFNELKRIESVQVIETNAHAAFCGLLGRIPFLKQTSEGRIQRQIVLIQGGLHLKDPLQYYEEITRRKLLQGILPDETIFTSRELDALVSAFTARQSIHFIEDALYLGELQEGQISLPVKSLKDHYR